MAPPVVLAALVIALLAAIAVLPRLRSLLPAVDPLVLLPTFAVPLLIVSHLVLLVRFGRTSSTR